MFKPEILAPAGNMFKLKTAVRYGADAVYIGGRAFGLRSAAQNFSDAEIAQACHFAHGHGCKVYVVLNGFLFDEELSRLPPFLKVLERAGVDAVIVSDLGVVDTVRRQSKLTIHLSTQASTLNTGAARFWKSLGVTRIVLGREASIAKAAAIKKSADIEVEMFVHGAMCMAYSGNCTISNYTAGRDSNRGGCIQSCRFQYKLAETPGGDGPDGYFLSSKDLNGAPHLNRFVEHEIDSLKIEGRMKSALYVATTVSSYARARDAAMGVVPDSKRLAAELFAELRSMSHRDYTDASLVHKAGADSVYHHSDDHQPNSHELLGHVLDVRPNGYTAVLLKNRLERGDVCQLLDEEGGVQPLPTDELRNLSGQAIDRAQPNSVVLLPFVPQAKRELLLRKALS